MIDNRLFDFSEYYDRVALDLPDNCIIAEVGVATGASALYLAQRLHDLGKKFTLYMIDDMGYGGVNQSIILQKNILQSGLGESIELVWMDSLNASCRFPDSHFDFVFLDSSHTYEQTKAEIKVWYSKLKEGCLLSGHDFTSIENPEVAMAVNEIIPTTFTRAPEMASWQFFQPERILFTEQTTDGNGIWKVYKKFYWKP